MTNILIVDDDPFVQNMMRQVLARHGYSAVSASDGRSALEQIAVKAPDLIMLDLSMPGLNGFDVAGEIKQNAATCDIPVILITGMASVDNHVRAMEMGVDDFMPKNAANAEIIARVRAHLKVKQLKDQVKHHQHTLETRVAQRTDQLNKTLKQLRETSLETIFKLMVASEYRDNETGAHIKRMGHYCAAIAQEMGLGSKTVELILFAAPMHDVGKIGIPDSILLKPGKLDDAEWALMKTHTTIGADILSGSRIRAVRLGEVIARSHHEKWDGSGYPIGLRGGRIPLVGRIVAVADVFDALTSERPYKSAFPVEKAFGIIAAERGMHFDPRVVDAFFAIQEQILEIREANQDDQGNALFCMQQLQNEAERMTSRPNAA